MVLENQSSLLIVTEHVPVKPVEPGVPGAVPSVGAGVPGRTAVPHVAAAHCLQRGQRNRGTV